MSSQQELKRLQAIWYGKLKRDGFEDIEKSDDWLKTWSSTSQGKKSLERQSYRDDTKEYFRLVGQFFWEHKFRNSLEKKIWKLHTEGYYARHIAKILRPQYTKKKLNKDNVQIILTKLMQLMKKKYSGDHNDSE